jgi:hypothetical protein
MTWIHDELYRYYGEAVAFTPPFQILMPESKNLLICLCCKNIWTSLHVYGKHVLKSEGCHPTNQLLALEKLFGKKFDAAKNTTTNFSIVKKQQESIGELLTMIVAQTGEIEKHLIRIKNLENRVYKLGCCKCAGGQSLPPKIVSPAAPPQPTPKPAPAPIVKKPLINQIVSDSEESLTTDEDIDAYYNNTKLCVNAATCKDNQRDRRDYLMDCTSCKNPVCQNCYRKFNSTKINPICSDACRKNARSPK